MTSPRPSLTSSTSVVSTSSSDGERSEDDAEVPKVPSALPPSTKTTVTVGTVVVKEKSQMPGVLNGPLVNTHLNFFINRNGDTGAVNVNELVSDAVKINSETFKYLPPGFNSSSCKQTGTKEDLEGLSRRWCYLITALVILSLITLLGTAVLSLKSLSSPASVPSPAVQSVIAGMSAEEKKFAGLPNGPRIITRSMWLAAPLKEPLDRNSLPVPTVVVCHTVTSNCNSQPDCIDLMGAMQRHHQVKRHFADLGYNFLIGGDDSVYWSRGFDFVGAHTKHFNQGSIAVAFIGNYIHAVPSAGQIAAFNKLMHVGVKEGKITPDYTLVAQCQLQVMTDPGLALVHAMASWPHYNSSLPRCTRE